jgi:hypothetical protein
MPVVPALVGKWRGEKKRMATSLAPRWRRRTGGTDAELVRTNLRPYCLNFWLRALRSQDYNSLLERLT